MLSLGLRVRTSKPINSPSEADHLPPPVSFCVAEQHVGGARRFRWRWALMWSKQARGPRLLAFWCEALSMSSTDPRARKAYLRLGYGAPSWAGGWAASVAGGEGDAGCLAGPSNYDAALTSGALAPHGFMPLAARSWCGGRSAFLSKFMASPSRLHCPPGPSPCEPIPRAKDQAVTVDTQIARRTVFSYPQIA
jgi:hypothetical protein